MSSWTSRIKSVGVGRWWWRSGVEGHKVFRLLRFYSVVSLVGVVIAAVLLTLLVRKLAIQEYIELAEMSNMALAQTALREVRPELLRYLEGAEGISPNDAVNQKMSPTLSSAIAELMRDGSIVRVKIYNRAGMVVFSTKFEQIGEKQEDNGAFESAIKGRVASWLIYRDTLNRFNKETDDDNLMSTYIPIRGSPAEPIRGVFEIYTDANSLVQRNEKVQFQILFGVGLILMFLYFVLLLAVRRASAVIELQQHIIWERSATLEMLFSNILSSEERDKKKIAVDLHEGIAQTLCAIKAHLEDRFERILDNNKVAGKIDPIIRELQGAIEQVRDIAAGLRPSSLDDLGLLPTIDAFCRAFEHLYPEIRVDQSISLQETDTPGPLKIVIYRIVETAFGNIAKSANTNRIRLDLGRGAESIMLEIDNTPQDSAYAATPKDREFDLKLHFAKIQERAILSGGTFSVSRNAVGGVTLRASWPAAPVRTASKPQTSAPVDQRHP